MGAVRLRRIGIGCAVALIVHAMLIWGLFSFNPQMTVLTAAPAEMHLDIWPDLSRMNTRSNKMPTAKRQRLATEGKVAERTDIHIPDEAAKHAQDDTPEPIDLPPDLVRALRTRQACQTALAEGKDLPAGCPRSNRDIAALPLFPRDKAAYWDKVVAAQETYRRYKTSAGNTDYWRRVTGLRNYRDDTLRPGAYSDPKWQKFFNPDINPDSAHQRERDGN